MGEANVPAEQSEASEEPRLPAPDVHSRRSGDLEGSAAEGPAPSVRLIWAIRDRSSFEAVRRSRRRVRRGPITITSVPGTPGVPPQVGYAIGRKVGGAVVRNRLRRRLRAIVADLAPQLGPGVHLIGVAAPAASLSFHELRAAVAEALRAMGEGR
jgi:ribonuclease P protein component